MVLDSHFSVGFLDLFVGGIGCYFKDPVSAFGILYEHGLDGVEVGLADVEVLSDLLYDIHLSGVELTVGLGDAKEEVDQLQPGCILHVSLDLHAYFPEVDVLLQDLLQQVEVLPCFLRTEISFEEHPYVAQLRTHHFAVGAHHGCSKDQEAHTEVTALCGPVFIGAALHTVVHRTEDKTEDTPNWPAEGPAKPPSYPLAISSLPSRFSGFYFFL